jgi:DNA-binding CsgD family transcriptional regulator
MAVAADAAPLLERESELDTLAAALTAARAGIGRVIVVEGHAGLGRSCLLAKVAELANRAGMEVLSARGDRAEREFAFGVALQLLEARVQKAAADERDAILSGAAGHAGALLEGAVPAGRDGHDVFSLVHGLHWVVRNVAERRPVLLLVDDAHWLDNASLRFLVYLAQRIGELPVALVAARRLDEPGESAPLAPLVAVPGARVLRLAPLDARSVSALVRRRLPRATRAFCDACADATRGNPFFLEELLATVVTEGVPATDEGAEQVRRLAPDAISLSILVRLSGLPPEAAALARAVAVLGEAPLVDAAGLAGIEPTTAARVAGALAAAGILAEGETLAFSHPIVRGTVYTDTALAQRGHMHARAARLLLSTGAAPERVAAHLLAAPPGREPSTIEPLRLAAARALAGGAPEPAARYLRRALDEAPPRDVRANVLVELGRAEAMAGERKAADRFEAALELLAQPVARARVLLLLGRVLFGQGRLAEAAAAFERGVVEARGRDTGLVAKLETGCLGVAILEPAGYPAAERIVRLVAHASQNDGPAARPLAAAVALTQTLSGGRADDVRALAEHAWADGALLAERGPDSPSVYLLAAAFAALDELELALSVLDDALAEARRRGSAIGVATASYFRALVFYFQGRIPEALADMKQAARAEAAGWELFLPSARAVLAFALLERGKVDDADRALDLQEPERWRDSLVYVPYLEARARVRLAQRRPEEALDDAVEAGRVLEEVYGGARPRFVQWRCTAALAAAALGEHERARELCEDELRVARAEGCEREVGVALRAAGLVGDGEARIALLSEAVETLERSQSVLELMRALVDLGAVLRSAARRQEARQPLRRALDLASERGAVALADRARDELLAAGARPRRTALGGVEALTPSELRVARMAAEGLRNREIAEALFVSRKTVDYHLAHVYQKLHVGRDGLADALGARNGNGSRP